MSGFVLIREREPQALKILVDLKSA